MNCNRPACIGLFLLLATAPVQAQGPGLNFRELFQKLDANGDQVIEKGEVPDSAIPAFEKLAKLADANKDGKIEASELRDILKDLPGAGAVAAGGPGAGMARLKAMDKDGDGKVSKTEFTGPAPFFDRLDADKDGFVDKSEAGKLAAAATKGAAGMPAPGGRLLAMDKDKDGKVSKAEFTGPTALFERLDLDKDGSLNKDEATKGASAIIDRVKAMDKDGDGKVSREEFPGRPARFNQLDANKDGSLSPDEMRDARPDAPATKKAAKAAAKQVQD